MDTTGWGTIIIMLDVVLSLLSVVSYIVTTYGLLLRVRAAMQVLSSVGMRPLRVLHFACQCMRQLRVLQVTCQCKALALCCTNLGLQCKFCCSHDPHGMLLVPNVINAACAGGRCA
jgi:hypothetical protein